MTAGTSNVESSSLWRDGPVISELKLEGPALKVVHLPDGRFNFSDLIDEWMEKPESNDPASLFSLNNIQITGGRLEFDDSLRPSSSSAAPMLSGGVPLRSAGKDRTGVLAMLLLGSMGVPHEYIVADYALTADGIARMRVWAQREAPEMWGRGWPMRRRPSWPPCRKPCSA